MAKLSISPDPKNMNIQAWNFKFWLCVAGCGLVCLAVGRCGLLHHLEMPMKLSLSFCRSFLSEVCRWGGSLSVDLNSDTCLSKI